MYIQQKPCSRTPSPSQHFLCTLAIGIERFPVQAPLGPWQLTKSNPVASQRNDL